MSFLKIALVGCCAVSLATLQIPSARAADLSAPKALDDKAPALPLTVSFDKVTGTEGGPYILKLTNGSADTIKASAKIYPSVSFHADSKTRDLPEHVIDPGKAWSIPGLAATDKVTVTAAGYAPLEITVP